jgi:hypothetical protein
MLLQESRKTATAELVKICYKFRVQKTLHTIEKSFSVTDIKS